VNLGLIILDPTSVISSIWSLAVLLPSISVAARRLHDINRSGWHQLLALFFPIGSIALLVWYCFAPTDGQAETPHSGRNLPNMSALDVLEKLAKLKESGAITQEKYDIEKRKIING
jgi:hypothetical protein